MDQLFIHFLLTNIALPVAYTNQNERNVASDSHLLSIKMSRWDFWLPAHLFPSSETYGKNPDSRLILERRETAPGSKGKCSSKCADMKAGGRKVKNYPRAGRTPAKAFARVTAGKKNESQANKCPACMGSFFCLFPLMNNYSMQKLGGDLQVLGWNFYQALHINSRGGEWASENKMHLGALRLQDGGN